MNSYHPTIRICGFIKTQHFLERQFEREVPDHILRLFLKRTITCSRFYWIVIRKTLLRKWSSQSGHTCPGQNNLIVVAVGDKLVTCYYGKLIHS